MKKILLLFIILIGFPACVQNDKNDVPQRDYVSVDYVNESIRDAKYCKVDEDCVSIGNICPFGCGIAINKNEKDSILNLISLYDKSAEEEGILSSCEPCPLPGWISCMRGFCTMLYE